jgi:hypothetical protein
MTTMMRYGFIHWTKGPSNERRKDAEMNDPLIHWLALFLQRLNRVLGRFFRAVGCPPIPPPSPTPPCPYCGNPVRLVFLRSGVCCAACGHTLTRDDLRVLGFTVLEED